MFSNVEFHADYENDNHIRRKLIFHEISHISYRTFSPSLTPQNIRHTFLMVEKAILPLHSSSNLRQWNKSDSCLLDYFATMSRFYGKDDVLLFCRKWSKPVCVRDRVWVRVRVRVRVNCYRVNSSAFESIQSQLFCVWRLYRSYRNWWQLPLPLKKIDFS